MSKIKIVKLLDPIQNNITIAGITVEEQDGSPSVANVIKFQLPNGSLTDNGGGSIYADLLTSTSASTDFAKLDLSNQPFKPDTDSTTALEVQDSSGSAVVDVDTTNKRLKVTSGTAGQSTLDDGIIVNNNSSSEEKGDFIVKTATKTAIETDAGDDTLSLIGFGVNGDIDIGSSDAFYFGDKLTDGSWRIVRSGNNLVYERRESGAWVNKSTMTP